MNVQINGKELLDLLNEARKDDRKQMSLYLSQSLYERLKKLCGVLPASIVVEALIKEFVETAEGKRNKSR